MLVNLMFWEVFCPLATVPKFRLAGEIAKLAIGGRCGLPPAYPVQPFRNSKGTSASAKKIHLFKPRNVSNSRDARGPASGPHLTVSVRPFLIESTSHCFIPEA